MKSLVSTKKQMKTTSRKPTGSLHSSSIQTKIMPLGQQRPLKVCLCFHFVALWGIQWLSSNQNTYIGLEVLYKTVITLSELMPWHFPPPEIGNAYAVLSNSDKRRQYDLTGGEEPSSPAHSHGGGFDFHRGFEADITPEDLFNMFFGGGFPSGMFAALKFIIFNEVLSTLCPLYHVVNFACFSLTYCCPIS